MIETESNWENWKDGQNLDGKHLLYCTTYNTTHPLNIIYLWTNSSRKTAYIPWEHTIRGFRNCFQKNWGIPVSWENDTFSFAMW